jgi:hypothetical protein
LRGLVAALVVVLLASPVLAQTASGTVGLATRTTRADTLRKTAGVSADNPWVLGTQLAARFAGEGEFTSSLLVGSQFIYDLPFNRAPRTRSGAGGGTAGPATGRVTPGRRFLTNFHLPVAANLGAVLGGLSDEKRDEQLAKATSALLSDAQGITFGLHPYGSLPGTRNMRWTLFGEAGAKVNSLPPLDTADTRVELIQGRFSGGLETRIGDTTSTARPLTLSAALVGSVFSGRNYQRAFGEDRSSIMAAEFTAILPLQTGTGIVAEAVVAKGFRPAIRFGILLTPARPASGGGGGQDLFGGPQTPATPNSPATPTTTTPSPTPGSEPPKPPPAEARR